MSLSQNHLIFSNSSIVCPFYWKQGITRVKLVSSALHTRQLYRNFCSVAYRNFCSVAYRNFCKYTTEISVPLTIEISVPLTTEISVKNSAKADETSY